MSDSGDEDLFGSGDEANMKVDNSSAQKSGSLVARATPSAEEDSDDDLFGDREGGDVPQSSASGAPSRLTDSDDDLIERAAGTQTTLAKTKESTMGGMAAFHLKDRGVSKLYLPPVTIAGQENTISSGKQKLVVRFPTTLKAQSDGYDRTNYNAVKEELEFATSKSSIVSGVIRWRFKCHPDGSPVLDAHGQPVRESNARLQKLKNGSFRLVVGNAIYHAPTEEMVNHYMYASAPSVPPADAKLTAAEESAGVTVNSNVNLECIADLNGSLRLTLRADESNANVASSTHRMKGLFAKTAKIQLEDRRLIVERPEVVAERMQKEEEARGRQTRRERERGLANTSGGAGGRGGMGIGMRQDYLTADQEDQYESYNISDIKNGGKPAREAGRKPDRKAAAAGRRGNFDSAGDDDDDYARRRPKAGRKNGDDDDDGEGEGEGDFSDDIDDDDEEDEGSEAEDSDDEEDDDDDLEGFIEKGSGDDEDSDEEGRKKSRHFKKGNKPVPKAAAEAKKDKKKKKKAAKNSDSDGSEAGGFSENSDNDATAAAKPKADEDEEEEEEAAAPSKSNKRDANAANVELGDSSGAEVVAETGNRDTEKEAAAAPKKRARRVIESDDDE